MLANSFSKLSASAFPDHKHPSQISVIGAVRRWQVLANSAVREQNLLIVMLPQNNPSLEMPLAGIIEVNGKEM